jgi:uncharacterized protein YuzB (UPF0349 family)
VATVKKIEYCISNLDLGTQVVLDAIAQSFPDIKIRQWGCLGHCHRCIRVPYVLIDDTEYIESPSAKELWEKVRQHVQQHQSNPAPVSRNPE